MTDVLKALTLALALAVPVAASAQMFPPHDYPQPGTFCGPLTLCDTAKGGE